MAQEPVTPIEAAVGVFEDVYNHDPIPVDAGLEFERKWRQDNMRAIVTAYLKTVEDREREVLGGYDGRICTLHIHDLLEELEQPDGR